MNKEIAIELDKECKIVAQRFSRTDREQNFNNETFEVDEIIPMSDHTATVVFKKSSGKLAAAFFYYIAKGYSKGWKYFFPTDSHINGLASFHYFKLEVERKNYDKNFIS
jgi:hypothetical protein